MATTIVALEARSLSAGSRELLRLLLAAHTELEQGARAGEQMWNWAMRDAIARADAHLTELVALLLPAVIAYEDERDWAEAAAHDDFLRAFPDDDPPF